MIEISNFCKCYGTEKAVSNVSFQVQAGQILGLIGRNGAGKTTTLRALTGIVPATSGELRVAGYEIGADALEVKQRTAYVPDDPQLFQDLSVEQHLLFTASVYGIRQPNWTIDGLLKQFDLEPKRHAAASGLSRGMRQKLAICCAWLQDPGALLLDEPMTGLDPPGIRKLKDSIVQHACRGAAVIISSHLLAMVEDICTHLLILEKGQLKYFGPLSEVEQQVVCSQTPADSRSLESIFFAALDQPDAAPAQMGASMSPNDFVVPSSSP